MRQIFSFSALLFCYTLVAQPLNQTNAQGQKQGKWKNYYDGTQTVKYEGQFESGKPVGKFTYYNENGRVVSVIDHSNSKVSYATFYDKNGSVSAFGKYVEKKKDSIWTFFNTNGLPISRESYKDGELNGLKLMYSNEGVKIGEETYVNGQRTGPFKTWFISGQLQIEGAYMKGYLHGHYKEYRSNGKPYFEGRYDNGVNIGEWLYYNENGTLRTQTLYIEGKESNVKKMNGRFETYYPNETLESVYHYQNGKRNGEFEVYYDNASWEIEERYDELRDTKDSYRVLKGHTVQQKGTYWNGKLHGEITYFNKDGSIAKKQVYEKGVLQ